MFVKCVRVEHIAFCVPSLPTCHGT
jgi:hypothetical protein